MHYYYYRVLVAIITILWSNVALSDGHVRVLALGDSLTAGYGVDYDQALPNQLENILRQQYATITIDNAGISGDTTKGGLQRLNFLLRKPYKVVIVALGANDALRGIAPKQTYDNLYKMLTILADKNIKILLLGMQASPAMGATYKQEFDGIYSTLYNEFKPKSTIELYPFMLQDVAFDATLNLSDNIHPNPQGIAIMAHNIAPYLERLLP